MTRAKAEGLLSVLAFASILGMFEAFFQAAGTSLLRVVPNVVAAARPKPMSELPPQVVTLLADLRTASSLTALSDKPFDCGLSGKTERFAYCDFRADRIDVRLGWKRNRGTPISLGLEIAVGKDLVDFTWIDPVTLLRVCPGLPRDEVPARAAEALSAQQAAVWRLTPGEPGTAQMTDGATRATDHMVGGCRLVLSERAWIGGLSASLRVSTRDGALRFGG